MNIHEYQAKQLLKKYGVSVPNGYPAFSSEEAFEAANKLQSKIFVVKSQIHAGGRGKGKFKEAPNDAGGVRLVKSANEVKENVSKMLGNTLVTHQTGDAGQKVQRVYIEEGSNIEHEYYISIIIDRKTSRPVFIASTEGGMDIEEVSASNPEKIISVSIDPATGISAFHARELAFGLKLSGNSAKSFMKLVFALYKAFVETDASQIEINPLVRTSEGEIIALDAKMNFDSNALYRQKNIYEMRDETEENPLESRAIEHDLSYVAMDGNIGCMVNGAGLAMSTMDIIKLHGAEPANFLDVGGSATKDRVTEAFKIIISDDKVQGILVNIFGGIMKCDVIAEGVIAAVKEVSLSVPLVVRLEGTNVELGKELLEKSGLPIITANDLDDAAIKVIAAVKK